MITEGWYVFLRYVLHIYLNIVEQSSQLKTVFHYRAICISVIIIIMMAVGSLVSIPFISYMLKKIKLITFLAS